MKYFTPEWWAGEVKDPNTPTQEYYRYIDSIRVHLSPAMASLQDEVSLHDSKLRDLSLDLPAALLILVLDGEIDPWAAVDEGPRRFTLSYRGLRSFQVKGRCSTCLFGGTDLGYQEIEMLDNGMFEHRLLFAGGTEFVIRFADFQLDCLDLHETREQPQ